MGELEQRLHDDMVGAMRERDKAKTETLRMAIGAIRNEKVAGKQARELSGAEELAVIRREVNSRRDSAEAYADANRPELAAKELSEAELLATYLPQPLTPDELGEFVAAEVAAVEAELGSKPGMKQMGRIVKAVSAAAEGRADGRAVADAVRARLS